MSEASEMTVCYDHQRRTCIQVERVDGRVKFIPLDVDGLQVCGLSQREFDDRFKPIAGYPVKRACELYLSYSQNIGATQEALGYLGRVITITKEVAVMATNKRAAAEARQAPAPAKPSKAVSAKATPKKAEKPVKADAKPAPKKSTGEKRHSAAQMFQDLIMQGKLTDDQIFAKVKAEFNLDDGKRGYVGWYRNHLRKQGQNPPDAK